MHYSMSSCTFLELLPAHVAAHVEFYSLLQACMQGATCMQARKALRQELLEETGNKHGIKAYLPAATSRLQTNVRADVCSGGTISPPAHVPEPPEASGEAACAEGPHASSGAGTLPLSPLSLPDSALEHASWIVIRY
jgi:hypothetical protein